MTEYVVATIARRSGLARGVHSMCYSYTAPLDRTKRRAKYLMGADPAPGDGHGELPLESDVVTRKALKPRDSADLLWYLRTEMSLRPRTLDLNEFLMRKATGWRSKNTKDIAEVDWHFMVAGAIQALSGGYIDRAYELFMRNQGVNGVKRINLLTSGFIAPAATWFERMAAALGFSDWSEARRLGRSIQVVPKTI